MNRLQKMVTLCIITIVLGVCAQPASAKDQTLRIGMNNWAENVAVSNMWKILLEERGYDVELMDVGNAVMYGGVASGDLDIGMEVWLPTADKPMVERFGDQFDIQEPWYKNTRLGLVVPAYVDIDSIEDLKAAPEAVNGEIFGIDSGSSLNALTRDAIKEYDLDVEFTESSEPAMLGRLDQSYQAQEPVVVTLWNPHWSFAEYDLKYLEDPANVYGDGDDIFFITREGFAEDFGPVLEWMNTWFMTDAQLSSLMKTIKDTGDPVKGASMWIEDNQKLVDSWFQ